MLASEHGHLDVVRELLTAQANVNSKDKVNSLSDLRSCRHVVRMYIPTV